MLNLFLVLAIPVWFTMLYPLARRNLAVAVRPLDARLVLPMVLVCTFAFMPLVFTVPREDGNAVLEEGLSASNIITLVLTGLTGLYLLGKIGLDRRIALLPFAMPYLPFTLMIGMDGLSTAWSIVPPYTLYRSVELLIFYHASIVIFDQSDIEYRFADILAIIILSWLAAVLPIILESLAHGTIFSAAKNNMMPYVCAMLGFLVIFRPPQRRRGAYLGLALIGFVVAGSAASTGALVAVGPAMLMSSRHVVLRNFGIFGALAAIAGFVLLMLDLAAFPALLDLLATILQKPAVELANGTGRSTFWPTFIAATQDRLAGSGFSAGDRFIQLLIPTTTLAETLGREDVFITSSHNMFLSAWAGTGMIGLGFSFVVLFTTLSWGMKLDLGGRRFVASCVLMLVLNGMTTPGIYQDWNVNVLALAGLLAFIRVQLPPDGRADRPAPISTDLRPEAAVANAWRIS
ncbi:O-antigen ligase domain-containing protein [Methylobacterium sp. 37f]|uniref:O-antigen ligase domain-containing protein n=1 Tax=Methylobacterium sp. 37f TaxID=2817058 RepID=UPI001FFDE7F9|nr:O-antigen ligase domain-containing protein [Methylobacterium sp. 37f]MCK2056176.1 O-antigen ligase domain-containing protein [Methylobacterium sp. 37f]